MWIQFDEKQLAALKRVVNGAHAMLVPKADTASMRERIAHYENPTANDQRFRDAVDTDDELECDDDAATSPSDLGAFVQTWTWVTNKQAGIDDDEGDIRTRQPVCIACGQPDEIELHDPTKCPGSPKFIKS